MMKVTIKKYLNVRVGSPSLNAPCYQYLEPGSVLTVDGNMYKGDLFEGNDTWLKDEADNYYWSGGVESLTAAPARFLSDIQSVINSSFDGQTLKSPVNYKALLEIDEALKSNAGKGVTIGIVDHPISSSIAVMKQIIRPFHVNDPLFNFHANFIAGLIAGASGITGIADMCTLMELPVYNARANSSGIDIAALLNFINNQDVPMIINISNGLDSRFNNIINGFKKDKIIVSCAGIDEELASPVVRDPASQPNVITVGAISKRPGLLPPLNPKIDFVLANYNFVSFQRSNQQFTKDRGDSFSCAVVSAIIALLISSGKVSYDVDDIKKELEKIALPFSDDSSFDSFNIINTKA